MKWKDAVRRVRKQKSSLATFFQESCAIAASKKNVKCKIESDSFDDGKFSLTFIGDVVGADIGCPFSKTAK